MCKLHCGGVQVRHPPSLLGWTIDAARLFAFSALADVDSQLQMEREFSFHLQLEDVAPRLQMEMEEMCDTVSCTLLPCNRPRLCWWLDCVLARCATCKFSQSQWDHSDFIRRATVVEFIFFPQKIRRSELPVEECVAKFCDAVAVMPEATWFNISPNHEAYGKTASFYHLVQLSSNFHLCYMYHDYPDVSGLCKNLDSKPAVVQFRDMPSLSAVVCDCV